MNIDQTSRLMNAIGAVTLLTQTGYEIKAVVVSKAQQHDYDTPSGYAALANTLLGISEHMAQIEDITQEYPDAGLIALVDGNNERLVETLDLAAQILLGVAGALAYAIDRTIIPDMARHALNELSIALAEPLAFPDDADAEQLDRAERNVAYSDRMKIQLAGMASDAEGESLH